MKTSLIFATISALILSGCVGVGVTTGNNKYSENINDVNIKKYSNPKPWDGVNHIPDETVTVKSEFEWCGITIMAIIIPIPLWLPVCKSYTDVTFVNNQPSTITIVRPNHILYACGPGVWLGTGFMHGYDGPQFCAKIK